jgi:hypothetical protein
LNDFENALLVHSCWERYFETKSKTHQIKCGQFKTQRGTQIYAIISAATDVCIKSGQNVWLAFLIIAKLHSE